jgi:hypothetical protein
MLAHAPLLQHVCRAALRSGVQLVSQDVVAFLAAAAQARRRPGGGVRGFSVAAPGEGRVRAGPGAGRCGMGRRRGRGADALAADAPAGG